MRSTRRRVIAAFAAALAAAGCGGGPDTCADLADDAVVLIQEAIDAVDDPSGAPDPGAPGDFEARGDALERRALELGCTPEEMAGLLAERVGRLDAGSEAGQAVIESLRDGRVTFLFGE